VMYRVDSHAGCALLLFYVIHSSLVLYQNPVCMALHFKLVPGYIVYIIIVELLLISQLKNRFISP
jgi:hypothetical protein